MGLVSNFFKRLFAEAMTEIIEPRMRGLLREEMQRQFNGVWLPQIRVIVREEVQHQLEEIWLPQIRVIVREEAQRQFEGIWLPQLRGMWREDMRQVFEQEWLPQLRGMWREDMRQVFEQEWLPQLRGMWREDMRQVFEQEWLPQLRKMWREDIEQAVEAAETRLREDLLKEIRTLHFEMTTSVTEKLLSLEERWGRQLTAVRDRMDDLYELWIRQPIFTQWDQLVREVQKLREEMDRVKAHIGLD